MGEGSIEPFAGSERLLVRRRIGAGGMGVVYEALDTEWNLPVAVKTLRALGPEALVRLKNEFRALQGLHHRNLVRLGELFADRGHWLFTMELVDGASFIEWVRPGGAVDEARLRAALRQLAEALHALHAAGKVHRDVKPTNVLVTGQGRVVLLDFGLITRVAADDALTAGNIVGTVEYMAPEQAAGLPVTPAADWYGLGALLYEALSGRLPFAGEPWRILDAKQKSDPPPPSTFGPVAADLDRLCMALLARDPARRLGWSAIAAQLGIASPSADDGAHELPFVGRGAELAVLEQAFADARAGANVTVLVHGESGIGKTVLIDRLIDRLYEIDGDVLVLRGRASDRELVPFNGFDGIVDGLARYLVERPDDQAALLLPDDADALVALFPVLGRAPGFRGEPMAATSSAMARRAQGFLALRRLLTAVAKERPLALVLDDFQWADDDTLALERALMRGRDDAGRLMVAACRTTSDARAFLRRALEGAGEGDVRHLYLERLSDDEARAAVHQILGGDGGDDASIVRESHGHPLFLTQIALARRRALHAKDDLHATIRARAASLSKEGQHLLQVLSASGGPIRHGVAARAAALDAERYLAAAEETRAAGLTRVEGAGLYAAIEPYHDQIRQAVLDELAPDERRALHRALAEAIEAAGGGTEPRMLFLHWLGAGDDARAAGAAMQAAGEADRQLAFERAAHYYGRALELGGPRALLLPKRACALANAGKKREAVAAYREAAAHAGDDEGRIEHLRAAAEVLLRNGDIDEGVQLLGAVLAHVRLPWPGDRTVLLRLVAARLRARVRGLGWRERGEAELPRRTLLRIDTAWSAAMALVNVDRARGAYFQTRALMLALDAGEPYRVARAVLLEAAFVGMAGVAAWPQTQALLAEGRRLAERSGHPHALALATTMEGVADALRGELRAAARRLEAAIPELRRHGTRWDVLNAEYLHLTYLQMVGDLAPLEQHLRALDEEARASEDRYTLVNLRTGYAALVRLLHDDVAGGRAALEESMRSWSQAGFHRQHWYALFAQANFDLYEGKGADAWRRVDGSWRIVERSQLLRSQFVRVGALFLRGRAALASGRRHEAQRAAARLEREGAAWATAFAALLRASIDPDAAAFARAAALLQGADLRMHAAVARRRAGQEDLWWKEQGVANPDGFVRCFAPRPPG
jgi:eukaryotic-like serine/threonine-protein kinase